MSGPGESDPHAEARMLAAQVKASLMVQSYFLTAAMDAYEALQSHPGVIADPEILTPVHERLAHIGASIGALIAPESMQDKHTPHGEEFADTQDTGEDLGYAVLTSVNEQTLLVGREYLPLVGSQAEVLRVLQEARLAGSGPLSITALHERMGVHATSGGAVVITREAARNLTHQLNTLYDCEVISFCRNGNAYSFQINPDVQLAQLAARTDERLPLTPGELAGGIIDVSRFSLPSKQEADSIVIKILSDDEIMVNGRVSQLYGHNLTLFNALVAYPGYNTPRQLSAYAFASTSPTTVKIPSAVQALRGHLNTDGEVLLTAGAAKNTMYALSARVLFVDIRKPGAIPTSPIARTERITVMDTDDGKGDTATEAGSSGTEQEAIFSNLLASYRAVGEQYRKAPDQDRRYIAEFERTIAEATQTDPETVRDMLVLLRLSDILGQSYGPDRSETPMLFNDHRDAVFAEMNSLLSRVNFREATDKDSSLASIRLAVFGLHTGLPSSLPVLARHRFNRLNGGQKTYPDSYKWTRARNGELGHIATQLGLSNTDRVRSLLHAAIKKMRAQITIDQNLG